MSAKFRYDDEKRDEQRRREEELKVDPDLEGLIEFSNYNPNLSKFSIVYSLAKEYKTLTKTAWIAPVLTGLSIGVPILTGYLNDWVHSEVKIEGVKQVLSDLIYLANLQISDGAGSYTADFNKFKDSATKTKDLIDKVVSGVKSEDPSLKDSVPEFITNARKTLELSARISNDLLQLQDWSSTAGWLVEWTSANSTRKVAFDRKIMQIQNSLGNLIEHAEEAYSKSSEAASRDRRVRVDTKIETLKERLKQREEARRAKQTSPSTTDSDGDEDLLASRFSTSGKPKPSAKPSESEDFDLTDETGY
jgi:hypothetical protein